MAGVLEWVLRAALALNAVVALGCIPSTRLQFGRSTPTPVPLPLEPYRVSLSTFPSVVLVPPASLQPFASLGIAEVRAPSPAQPLGEAQYSVLYGRSGGDGAAVSGYAGRRTWDELPRRFSSCLPEAVYCRGDANPISGTAYSETFRGLRVGTYPAVAEHITCCNGLYWVVTWYDQSANATYRVELAQAVARPYGEMIDAANAPAAQRLAELASRLVPLRR